MRAVIVFSLSAKMILFSSVVNDDKPPSFNSREKWVIAVTKLENKEGSSPFRNLEKRGIPDFESKIMTPSMSILVCPLV